MHILNKFSNRPKNTQDWLEQVSTTQSHKAVLAKLESLADPERAKSSEWFFKTGPGQYGEGDRFFGIRVPVQREVAREFSYLPLNEVLMLLKNQYHEARLTAVFMLVNRYRRGDEADKKAVYEAYVAHTAYINNWDIVDSSAHKIVGPYLADKPEKMQVLRNLTHSDSLWERRIAVISTAYYIAKLHAAAELLELAELLLHDEEDLIHKAVGWMLREVGKYIDTAILTSFLDAHAHEMPRTMLRYAIERLDEPSRTHYLSLRTNESGTIPV